MALKELLPFFLAAVMYVYNTDTIWRAFDNTYTIYGTYVRKMGCVKQSCTKYIPTYAFRRMLQ